MEFNKEMFEKMIGREVSDVKVEPVYENGELIKLNISVVPVRSLKFIDLDFKVLPTGAKFEDIE